MAVPAASTMLLGRQRNTSVISELQYVQPPLPLDLPPLPTTPSFPAKTFIKDFKFPELKTHVIWCKFSYFSCPVKAVMGRPSTDKKTVSTWAETVQFFGLADFDSCTNILEQGLLPLMEKRKAFFISVSEMSGIVPFMWTLRHWMWVLPPHNIIFPLQGLLF